MCGRAYSTFTEGELADRYLNEQLKKNPFFDLEPDYNIAPTDKVPVVLFRNGHRSLELFRWGLIPAWTKDVEELQRYSLINAKLEEITEKKSYAEPFKKRRCIFPVSGFYEWKAPAAGSKTKRPFAIRLKGAPIMSLGGVWEEWVNKKTGETFPSFAIVTLKANAYMAPLHNRMPLVLNRKNEEAWLNPQLQDPKDLTGLLQMNQVDDLEAYEISTLVNSVKNNTPENIKPLTGT